MGILNVTPDSFSDGGQFVNPRAALIQAERLLQEGADILDIGAESTRPDSTPVSCEEELRRLFPVMTSLRKEFPKAILSIDTSKYSVMERMLDLGAHMINDVCAMRTDSRIPKLLKQYQASVCLMHMRGTPQTMQQNTQYDDMIEDIRHFLKASVQVAVDAGISKDAIIVDPGVGFGKSKEGNLTIINQLNLLISAVSFPHMIGISRKRFVQTLAQQTETSIEMVMAQLHMAALTKGAKLLRVHDIALTKKTLNLYEALVSK